MRLRNKKTGEIMDVYKSQVLIHFDSGKKTRQFKSLGELNEEWEDYEEPKEHWMIDVFGDVDIVSSIYTDDMIDELREIGNYFETKEEAKKAVEKLKAFKRLKDNGFSFERWEKSCNTDGKIIFHLDELGPRLANFRDDLNTLFGGEE